MVHDPRTVANELIRRGFRSRTPLTHIEAENLLYFCQGWMLGIHGQPFHDCLWEAWRYGPVLPEVYFSLNHHRGKPLTSPIKTAPGGTISEDERAILEAVYGYRRLGVLTLAGITQSEGGPWDRAWRSRGDGAVIGNDDMKSYFAGLLRSSSHDPAKPRTGAP